jgi:hypothetical protein
MVTVVLDTIGYSNGIHRINNYHGSKGFKRDPLIRA